MRGGVSFRNCSPWFVGACHRIIPARVLTPCAMGWRRYLELAMIGVIVVMVVLQAFANLMVPYDFAMTIVNTVFLCLFTYVAQGAGIWRVCACVFLWWSVDTHGRSVLHRMATDGKIRGMWPFLWCGFPPVVEWRRFCALSAWGSCCTRTPISGTSGTSSIWWWYALYEGCLCAVRGTGWRLRGSMRV